MDPFFLIIPVVLFVIAAGVNWWLMSLTPFGDDNATGIGKLDDLSRIVSVMMTAKLGERRLVASVHRRVTSLEAHFHEGGLSFELPLVTKSQLKHRKKLLALAMRVGVEAGENEDAIVGSILGNPEEVTAKLKDLFLGAFEVAENKKVQYEISAWASDIRVMGWSTITDDETRARMEPYPDASAVDADASEPVDPHKGCFLGLALALLWPVPFVFSYYLFGIIVACWVGLAEVAVWLATRMYFLRKPLRANAASFMLAITTLGFSLTVFTGVTDYLQMVPTIFCVWLAGYCLFKFWQGSGIFSKQDKKRMFKSARSRSAVAFSIVLVSAGGAALNEHMRINAELDLWVWYFAFFRLELIVGFLLFVIPMAELLVLAEQEKTD